MLLFFIQSLKLGTRSFIRNGLLVFLTILAIVGIQIVFATGLFGKTLFNYSLTALERRVDVRLSLVTNAPTNSIIRLKQTLETMPYVKSVQHIVSSDIYEDFKQKHSTDLLTMQALRELPGNPFGDEMVIKFSQASYYQEFYNNISNPDTFPSELAEIIEDTDTAHNDTIIKKLSNFQKTANIIGLGTIIFAFFIFFLILIIISRLFLNQYSKDVKIMRSLGAPDSHIGSWLIVIYTYCIVIATAISLLTISGLFNIFDKLMSLISGGISMSSWLQLNFFSTAGFIFFFTLTVVHLVILFFLNLKKSN